jgi:hypothetical protein
LEQAVRQLLAENAAIRPDSSRDYYNDGVNYITLTEGGLPYKYILHYYGREEYWKTSRTARLSIVYAYSQSGGGSAGNRGVKWYDFRLKKELTGPFERAFVSRLDKKLGSMHQVE